MKNIKNVLKNKKGLIGLDYVCVAGVVLTLTAYILTGVYSSGKVLADNSIDQINSIETIVSSVDAGVTS